jgi:DNA-binding CsgD family transcriptional regulator
MALELCTSAISLLDGAEAPPRPGDLRFTAYAGVTSYRLAARISVSQALAMSGRFDEAIDVYRVVLEEMLGIAPLTQIAVRGGFSWCLAMQGSLDEADYWLSSALGLAEELGSQNHVRTLAAKVVVGLIHALRGEREAALDALELAFLQAKPARANNIIYCCDIVASMMGSDRAFSEQLETQGALRPLGFANLFIRAGAARRAVRLRRFARAIQELRDTEPHELTLASWTETLIAVEGRASAARWLAAQPPPSHEHGRIVRLLCEAAVTERASDAATMVETAIDLVEARGLVGPLWWAPAQLWRRESVARLNHPLVVDRIASLRRPPPSSEPALTAREAELLRLLSTELTVKELAEQLTVTVATLKWHRANLYRKLGVTNRHAAVNAGLTLGVLPRARRP